MWYSFGWSAFKIFFWFLVISAKGYTYFEFHVFGFKYAWCKDNGNCSGSHRNTAEDRLTLRTRFCPQSTIRHQRFEPASNVGFSPKPTNI